MKIDMTLRDKIKALKIRGTPAFVKTKQERSNAHNHAAALGYEIKTARRLTGKGGFVIQRTK